MNERRKQRRVDVAWILRLPRPQGGLVQSRTVNVSCSGLLFLSPQAYEKDEVLRIELDLSTGCTLHAAVRIARELPGGTRVHTYGAQFIEFADHGYERLEETLTSIRRRRSGARLLARERAQSGAAPVMPSPSNPTATRMDGRRWGPRAEDSPGSTRPLL